MSGNNWNRWGAEDEVGALNQVDAAKVLAGIATAGQGRVFSLAQPIAPGMPVPGHRGGVLHFMSRDGGDYAAGKRPSGGFCFAEDTVVLPTHLGTHIDALCHCWSDETLYNGFPASSVRSDGARRLGVDKLPPIVSRGVLLDFVKTEGRALPDGTAIGPAELERAIGRTGTSLEPGDVVVLRTGWQERQHGTSPDFGAEPGLNVEGAMTLVKAGVAAVAADNFAVEVMPFAGAAKFPVHQCLIRDYGIPLIEGLVVAPFAQQNVPVFLFIAAALPIKGATGSPLTPLAVI